MFQELFIGKIQNGLSNIACCYTNNHLQFTATEIHHKYIFKTYCNIILFVNIISDTHSKHFQEMYGSWIQNILLSRVLHYTVCFTSMDWSAQCVSPAPVWNRLFCFCSHFKQPYGWDTVYGTKVPQHYL